MIRRRRRTEPEDLVEAGAEEEGYDVAADAGEGGEGEPDAPADRPDGPWDSADPAPEIPRIDLGGMLVPLRDGMEIQVNIVEGQVVAATLASGPSAVQAQAFAAPKRSGLWAEVRREIRDELGRTGGEAEELAGPFGAELRCRIPGQDERGRSVVRPARFIGVDGPRWFLRGMVTGPAVDDPDAARSLEEAFRQIVVVRGDHPMAPRDLIELRLPPEARQALEDQAED